MWPSSPKMKRGITFVVSCVGNSYKYIFRVIKAHVSLLPSSFSPLHPPSPIYTSSSSRDPRRRPVENMTAPTTNSNATTDGRRSRPAFDVHRGNYFACCLLWSGCQRTRHRRRIAHIDACKFLCCRHLSTCQVSQFIFRMWVGLGGPGLRRRT